MAGEASSSSEEDDDGGDFGFVSTSDDEEEEDMEVSLSRRIETAGASLSLAGEGLSRVPASLMDLASRAVSTTLATLDLSCNAIAEVPRSVSRLRALRVLNLSHNKLTRLPSTIGASTGVHRASRARVKKKKSFLGSVNRVALRELKN